MGIAEAKSIVAEEIVAIFDVLPAGGSVTVRIGDVSGEATVGGSEELAGRLLSWIGRMIEADVRERDPALSVAWSPEGFVIRREESA